MIEARMLVMASIVIIMASTATISVLIPTVHASACDAIEGAMSKNVSRAHRRRRPRPVTNSSQEN
jgi:hypothetical protein